MIVRPPPMSPHRAAAFLGRRDTWAIVGAFLLLNAALSFSTWWPTPFIVLDARLAPEFVGLWCVLLVPALWRRGTESPWTGRGLQIITGGYLLLMLGRYLDVTIPALFGRPINAYWDLPQIPRFLWVTAQERPAWQGLLAVTLALVAGAGLYRTVRWAVGLLALRAVPLAVRYPWTHLITVAAVAVAAANYAGVQATWPYVSKPVVPVALRQLTVLSAALWDAGQAKVLPAHSPVDAARARGADLALAALRRRDVWLMPLESIGAIVYDHPEAQTRMPAIRTQFAADLAAGGWHVVSAFLKAPTFAGGSDLSHLSLLSGIDLSDPLRHDVLLTTQRETLITLFRSEGYQTYGVYPGVFWDWPERAFYRFDTYVDGPRMQYAGPPMGYWKIPDQFSVAQFERLHPRGAKPRFVFFPTISCHLPFSPVPPFQPDRERLLGPEPFDAEDISRIAAERPNWLNMRPDYWRMVEYTFQWLGNHLRTAPPDDRLYLFVGDHQPAASVTGEGASWDVPAYIVSRDPRLLQRFVQQGYHPGLEPPRAPIGGLHDLTDHLLQAASAGGPGVPTTQLAVRLPGRP